MKESENDKIVEGVKFFVSEEILKGSGKTRQKKKALDIIFKACMSKIDGKTKKNWVREYIGLSKKYFYTNIKDNITPQQINRRNTNTPMHEKKNNPANSLQL